MYIGTLFPNNFRFVQVLRTLIESDRYQNIPLKAKYLYSIVRDKLELESNERESHNVDANGRIFLSISMRHLAQISGLSRNSVKKYLLILEEFGLIERQIENVQNSRIFVKRVENASEDEFLTIHNIKETGFIQIPDSIIQNLNLSVGSKITFGYLCARMRLSCKSKGYCDSNGKFIIYTGKELAEKLHIGKTQAYKQLEELSDAGLIKIEQLGRWNRKIHIVNFTSIEVGQIPESSPSGSNSGTGGSNSGMGGSNSGNGNIDSLYKPSYIDDQEDLSSKEDLNIKNLMDRIGYKNYVQQMRNTKNALIAENMADAIQLAAQSQNQKMRNNAFKIYPEEFSLLVDTYAQAAADRKIMKPIPYMKKMIEDLGQIKLTEESQLRRLCGSEGLQY